MADRLAQLEALYAALLAHQADPRNVKWRAVLRAMKEVGKPDPEQAGEISSGDGPAA